MSYVMSYALCRLRAQKPTQAVITAGHTTISLARRGLMCICWNLLALKWSKNSCKTTHATLILQTRRVGSSASIVLRIPLSAGFHQCLLRGLEITMVRSLAYLPCVARNGRLVNWTPSYCTIWSHPAEAPVSFQPLAALSWRVSSSAADQRHVAIPSISLVIASGERPARSVDIWYHTWYHFRAFPQQSEPCSWIRCDTWLWPDWKWPARPRLFFNCTICSRGCQGPKYSANHKEVFLVYFSTFEPISLTPNSVIQQVGVPMLYDTASNPRLPCLYICPAANVLGRAPFIPCFIDGNTHPTIPYKFKNSWLLGQRPQIPSRIAGTAADCTRWIYGCGATDRARPGRCPSRRRRLPGRIESARQEKGQRRQRNATGRRQPESVQRQRNENVCSQLRIPSHIWYHIWYHMLTSAYDIIVGAMISLPTYDLMIFDMISWSFLWYHTTYDIICKIWYHSILYDIICQSMIS